MKTVILAGGMGTRISEESSLRPKPMIEIGGKPILWHILKIYSAHGIHDFIICLGYKGYLIKEYFSNYFLHTSDVTFDMKENRMEVHQRSAEPWKITLVDTGEQTMTGGRLSRVAPYLDAREDFCLTYGDGVSDVDLAALLRFHKEQKSDVTLTAIQPPGRWGVLSTEGHQVRAFQEKPQGDGSWINGGFFVCKPSVLESIKGDQTIWEREPLEGLAASGRVSAYRHKGFWYAMDTLRDKQHLEDLWASGKAPWKVW